MSDKNTQIYAIVAMSKNRVIGRNNRLPWHLPADLRHFKKITLGKTILMGRKTFDSIGNPLPGRKNVLITRDRHYKVEGVEIFHSIEDALTQLNETEIFVIGGAEIFKKMLALVKRLYLTIIDAEIEGDVFFPTLNMDEWKEVSCESYQADKDNIYPFKFLILERIGLTE